MRTGSVAVAISTAGSLVMLALAAPASPGPFGALTPVDISAGSTVLALRRLEEP
jgi:hypothetical protein